MDLEGLSNYWSLQFSDPTPRAPVYLGALSLFDQKPIDILEIGTIRGKEDRDQRFGDGGASIYWAAYVEKFGGHFKTVDIDEEAVQNVKEIIRHAPIKGENIEYICDDGMNHITDDFDLIFLDGAPGAQETFDQFQKINLDNTVVLIDDVWDKGVSVKKFLDEERLFYFYRDIGMWGDMIILAPQHLRSKPLPLTALQIS